MTLALVMGLVIPASAAVTENGLITITGVNAGEMYTGYKIFDVEYDPVNPNNVTYTIDANAGDILTLVKNYKYKGVDAFTLTPRTSDPNTLVVIPSAEFVGSNDAEAAASAKAFAEYLSANLAIIEVPATATGYTAYDVIAPDNFVDSNEGYQVEINVTEKVVDGQSTIYWKNLSYGYWFVKTTTGTICTLTTAKPSVTVADKNPDTTVDKKVKEDSDSAWKDDFNTVQIGQVVEYYTTINAKVGGINYKLYDRMTEGLTLDKDSITVFVDENGNGEKDAGETELVLGTDYTKGFDETHKLKSGETVDCDFVIAIDNDYIEALTADTKIVVAYKATVNENAKIKGSGAAIDYEHNDTGLAYGNNSETEWDSVKTYTLFFDLVKIDTAGEYLAGAQFELYYDEACTDKVPLVFDGSAIYAVATEEQQNAVGFTSAIIKAGHADIRGLDANTTYYLKEVAAPAGYNMVDGVIEVAIGDDSKGFIAEYTPSTDAWTTDKGGVGVVNKTGTELPSTGGMGTTLFYILGAALVLGAGIALVTRKRMSEE